MSSTNKKGAGLILSLAAARKVDLRRRVRGLQGTGNRQRRVDVTGCTAGSN